MCGGGTPESLERGWFVKPTTSRTFTMARSLHTGTVMVNGANDIVHAAFEGFEESGLGREGDRCGLEGFTEL